MDLLQRFHSKIEVVDNGCHEWTACRSKRGYGGFRVGDKWVLAHRFSYELYRGLIKGELDHLCRNHSCVNPDHLEDVTHLENMSRGTHATKTHCKNGHEFTPANTYYFEKRNKRVCRACDRERP